MKRKYIVMIVVLGMVFTGLFLMQGKNKNESTSQVIPVQLTDNERHIANLSFIDLFGYNFDNLGKAEIKIKLFHEGKLLQDYCIIQSKPDNQLKQLWLGFENVDNVNCNIVCEETYEKIYSKGKIDFKLLGESNPKHSTYITYVPKQIDVENKCNIIGAGMFSTNDGIANPNYEQLFSIKNVDELYKLYDKLAMIPECQYCYLIELHKY